MGNNRRKLLADLGKVNMHLSKGKSLYKSLELENRSEKDFLLIGRRYDHETNRFIKAPDYVPQEIVEVPEVIINNDISDSLTKGMTDERQDVGQLVDERMTNSGVLRNVIREELKLALSELRGEELPKGLNIEISLPEEADKNYRATIRINEIVYNRFKEFCSKHKQFTQKDLMSAALVEFIEKYDDGE